MSGPEGAVLALIEWAKRGPQSAEVDCFGVMEGKGVFAYFEQRETE